MGTLWQDILLPDPKPGWLVKHRSGITAKVLKVDDKGCILTNVKPRIKIAQFSDYNISEVCYKRDKVIRVYADGFRRGNGWLLCDATGKPITSYCSEEPFGKWFAFRNYPDDVIIFVRADSIKEAREKVIQDTITNVYDDDMDQLKDDYGSIKQLKKTVNMYPECSVSRYDDEVFIIYLSE